VKHLPIEIGPVALRSLLVLARQLRDDLLRIFVSLVGKVSFFHADLAALLLLLDPEEVVIHHLDSKPNGILLEVDDEGITVELSLVVGVHLDAFVAIGTLVNYAVLGEDLFDLDLVGIARQVRNIDSTVLLDLGLLDRLGQRVSTTITIGVLKDTHLIVLVALALPVDTVISLLGQRRLGRVVAAGRDELADFIISSVGGDV
jgi:hypothetical protein